MSTFALIFFPHTRTSDVVPDSSFPHGLKTGDTTRVRWQGRNYKGKILYMGPKEICEMKASSVSTDGELVEDVFDVSSVPQDRGALGQSCSPEDHRPSPREREQMTRQIRMEEDIAFIKNLLLQISTTQASQTAKIERLEQIGRELLRRNPPKQAQASAKEVAQLRTLKGQNRNRFALALEKMVYRDDPRELELIVDERVLTKERVVFIQECLYKYYEIPENLQEDAWRTVKETLNSRVMRLRKAIREGDASHADTPLYRLDIYD